MRDSRRPYPSDLSDAEWAIPAPGRGEGREPGPLSGREIARAAPTPGQRPALVRTHFLDEVLELRQAARPL